MNEHQDVEHCHTRSNYFVRKRDCSNGLDDVGVGTFSDYDKSADRKPAALILQPIGAERIPEAGCRDIAATLNELANSPPRCTKGGTAGA
jgi:hypothetical protein